MPRFLDRLERILPRFNKKEPEPQLPTAEGRAKEAFWWALVWSFTPEQLSAEKIFSPPHNTFDLASLRDQSLFRVEATSSFGRAPDSGRPMWFYGCVVANDTPSLPPFLFTLEDVRLSSNKRLFTDSIYSLETLAENRDNPVIRVKQIPYEAPLLQWEEPHRTFPLPFFDVEVDNPYGVRLTLHSVEVINSGTKQEAPEKQTKQQREFSLQEAQQGALRPTPT